MSFDKPSSQQEIFKVNFKLKINIKREIECIKVNRMPIILLKVMERGGIVCNLISPIYLGVLILLKIGTRGRQYSQM